MAGNGATTSVCVLFRHNFFNTNTKLRLIGRLFQKRCPSYLFPFQSDLTPPFRTREDATNARDRSENLTLQGIKRKLPVIFKLSDFEEKHISASRGTAAQSDATAPSCSRSPRFLCASLLFLPTSGTVAGGTPAPAHHSHVSQIN